MSIDEDEFRGESGQEKKVGDYLNLLPPGPF